MGDEYDLTYKSYSELPTGTPAAATDYAIYWDVSALAFKRCTVAQLLAAT